MNTTSLFPFPALYSISPLNDIFSTHQLFVSRKSAGNLNLLDFSANLAGIFKPFCGFYGCNASGSTSNGCEKREFVQCELRNGAHLLQAREIQIFQCPQWFYIALLVGGWILGLSLLIVVWSFCDSPESEKIAFVQEVRFFREI